MSAAVRQVTYLGNATAEIWILLFGHEKGIEQSKSAGGKRWRPHFYGRAFNGTAIG